MNCYVDSGTLIKLHKKIPRFRLRTVSGLTLQFLNQILKNYRSASSQIAHKEVCKTSESCGKQQTPKGKSHKLTDRIYIIHKHDEQQTLSLYNQMNKIIQKDIEVLYFYPGLEESIKFQRSIATKATEVWDSLSIVHQFKMEQLQCNLQTM